MQNINSNTWNLASAATRGGALLALCLAMAACKPSTPEAGIAAEPAVAAPAKSEPTAATPATAPASSDAPAAATPQTPAAPATAADTVSDEDMDPGLDDSYNVADFRPQYRACIKATDAVMPAIAACQDEELAYQEKRLHAALARINAGPDGYFKDEVGNWQAEYMRHTNINCGEKEKNGPVGEGQSCFMNRYANRADALEALADMADKANGKGN